MLRLVFSWENRLWHPWISNFSPSQKIHKGGFSYLFLLPDSIVLFTEMPLKCFSFKWLTSSLSVFFLSLITAAQGAGWEVTEPGSWAFQPPSLPGLFQLGMTLGAAFPPCI